MPTDANQGQYMLVTAFLGKDMLQHVVRPTIESYGQPFGVGVAELDNERLVVAVRPITCEEAEAFERERACG